jgi:hypothetical protein
MKLARKLTLAFLVVMVLVLSVNAALRIGSEVDAFREDVRRDHRTLARALRPAVASMSVGEEWAEGTDEQGWARDRRVVGLPR